MIYFIKQKEMFGINKLIKNCKYTQEAFSKKINENVIKKKKMVNGFKNSLAPLNNLLFILTKNLFIFI